MTIDLPERPSAASAAGAAPMSPVDAVPSRASGVGTSGVGTAGSGAAGVGTADGVSAAGLDAVQPLETDLLEGATPLELRADAAELARETALRPRTALRFGDYVPADGMVTPPDDRQLWWYLGSQNRVLQVAMTLAFAVASVSLVQFALVSPWLYPLLAILAISIVGSVLSLVTGLGTRRVSRESHTALLRAWEHETSITHDVPSVDVYLPCFGEDIAVLRNTYVHVSRLEWQGALRVFVLDDGATDAVRDLAAEFGFEYVVRPDRGHLKKAGNLRHAFSITEGEFILILDADFVPRTDFLLHTIPYMSDPTVGIVQTPQVFETKESMKWLERAAGATQELFYRWVQPSRDRAGAPVCVGTCAVYRRSALSEVGGFAAIDHSEDIHTGIALIHGGYRTSYVPILVSRGLCPSDLSGFINQQYRWCNGALTAYATPEERRFGMTLWQRICFWAGFLYYVSTALNVFAIYLPGVLMALFFAQDVRAYNYIPFLAGMWMYFVAMPRTSKARWRFEVIRVQMAYSFAHSVAIVHKIFHREAGWVATGAVGKQNHLAKTVSRVGFTYITLLTVFSWAALFRDTGLYGWNQFWPMALFLVAYSYLAVPLAWDFLKVLVPALDRSAKAGKVDGAGEDAAVTEVAVVA